MYPHPSACLQHAPGARPTQLLVPIDAERRGEELATYTFTGNERSCGALLWRVLTRVALLPFGVFHYVVNHPVMNIALAVVTLCVVVVFEAMIAICI